MRFKIIMIVALGAMLSACTNGFSSGGSSSSTAPSVAASKYSGFNLYSGTEVTDWVEDSVKTHMKVSGAFSMEYLIDDLPTLVPWRVGIESPSCVTATKHYNVVLMHVTADTNGNYDNASNTIATVELSPTSFKYISTEIIEDGSGVPSVTDVGGVTDTSSCTSGRFTVANRNGVGFANDNALIYIEGTDIYFGLSFDNQLTSSTAISVGDYQTYTFKRKDGADSSSPDSSITTNTDNFADFLSNKTAADISYDSGSGTYLGNMAGGSFALFVPERSDTNTGYKFFATNGALSQVGSHMVGIGGKINGKTVGVFAGREVRYDTDTNPVTYFYTGGSELMMFVEK